MQPIGSRGEMIDHVVKSGDTLYSIAWRYGYDPRKVAGWNNIPPPYTIYPGQHIYIISPYQQNARQVPHTRGTNVADRGTNRSATAPQPGSPPTGTQTERSVTSPINKVEKTTNNHKRKKVKWSRPTAGEIVNHFSPSDGKKGVDIAGKAGQPIFSAADGNVVYSGSSLIGYGNLIIVKHNETYLSAYGHNRRLLVKEGDVVKRGQKIAEMGESGKEGVLLHFEIRREGKPVDPIDYLPLNVRGDS
ncbi:MAG: peptidoglycan DD-metalloendopeptidase family protein [Pseudomonadota bacterium]